MGRPAGSRNKERSFVPTRGGYASDSDANVTAPPPITPIGETGESPDSSPAKEVWSSRISEPLYKKGQKIDFTLVKKDKIETAMVEKGTVIGLFYEVADAAGKETGCWEYHCLFEIAPGVTYNWTVSESELQARFKIFKV